MQVRVIHKIEGEWSEGISLGEYTHMKIYPILILSQSNPNQRQLYRATWVIYLALRSRGGAVGRGVCLISLWIKISSSSATFVLQKRLYIFLSVW